MAKKSKQPTIDELRAIIPQVVKENKAELIEEWYPCPDCGNLHGDESEAADCCSNSITEVYVCKMCMPKNGRMNESDQFVFQFEDDAEKHLAEHHTADESDPEEQYWNDLRFSGKPCFQVWCERVYRELNVRVPGERSLLG